MIQTGFPGGASESANENLATTVAWLKRFAETYKEYRDSDQSKAARERSSVANCGKGRGLTPAQRKLKEIKKEALDKLKWGQQLYKEVHPSDSAPEPFGRKRRRLQGTRTYYELTREEQQVFNEFNEGRLARLHDEAAYQYGFGTARTSNIVPQGQQFARQKPFRMPKQ